MKQAEIIEKLSSGKHPRCPECFRRFQSLPDHTTLGGFAVYHQLDSLPDHVKISLLLATTIIPTDDSFKPKYSTDLEPFNTNNSQEIDVNKITALKKTGCHVPTTFKEAINTVSEISLVENIVSSSTQELFSYSIASQYIIKLKVSYVLPARN